MTDDEQLAARRAQIPVHCAACGGEYTADDPSSKEKRMRWLIEFTDDELNAIYNAIEDSPRREYDEEATLDSVLTKITPTRVGDPTPAGAMES